MKSSVAALIVSIASTTVMAQYQVCFDMAPQGSLESFYYTFSGPWGTGSGQVSGQQQVCVPSSNAAGGAMYIDYSPNPGPGATKLECYFPDSGTSTCDVSLVDGYSVAVLCQTGNSPNIGGESLLTLGNTCPDQEGDYCINTNGYAPAQSDVDAFFQAGVNNGNNYCIWKDCAQLYSFPVTNTVSCAVTL